MQTVVYRYPKGGLIQIDREQACITITTESGNSASLSIGPQGVIELAQVMEQLGQDWLKAWRAGQ